ncbi:hypothetical protein BU14_1259s0001 [Porphyra umbilicalis]|uniref:Uncharacterized protein n=1 Tax=Porphyra umbilicalis TaxID=2786 RepID=A0A1X6NMB6_PORUM|nr:hypothetical protein BU14_1259s0001 [Porphyra umbilicalis]|eukprot:OSX69702.1 hypothetical protein BU14_1259s0001 [Porphyra umbilicalis]
MPRAMSALPTASASSIVAAAPIMTSVRTASTPVKQAR